MSLNFLIGFGLSVFVAGLAYRKKSLTQSGMIAAVLLGTIVYGLGHWIFYVLMMFFFMSSLIIRKVVASLYPTAHRALMHNHQKHEARTWVQVMANAGILGLISALYVVFPTNFMIFVAAVSMAAATSDTWASEIGILSHQNPRTLILRRSTLTGLSGGVTTLGLWASLAGSAMIALVYGLYQIFLFGLDFRWFLLIGLCTLGGFLGSLFDSVLGEFVQAKYRTQHSDIVETATSSQDILIQGFSWIDNNLVNFLSNVFVVASFSALILWMGVL